jgi:hypothetical protein
MSIEVMLANYSSEELTLPNATVIGVAEEISEQIVDAINAEMTMNIDPSTWRRANNKLYCKLLKGKMNNLDKQEKGLI